MRVITEDDSPLLCFALLPCLTRQGHYSFSYFLYLSVLKKNDLLILLVENFLIYILHQVPSLGDKDLLSYSPVLPLHLPCFFPILCFGHLFLHNKLLQNSVAESIAFICLQFCSLDIVCQGYLVSAPGSVNLFHSWGWPQASVLPRSFEAAWASSQDGGRR